MRRQYPRRWPFVRPMWASGPEAEVRCDILNCLYQRIENALRAAHEHCFENEAEVKRSTICSCFDCCERFAPSDIKVWTHDRRGHGRTAICPFCWVDSVLGDAAGPFATDDAFIRLMRDRYFSSEFSVTSKELDIVFAPKLL